MGLLLQLLVDRDVVVIYDLDEAFAVDSGLVQGCRGLRALRGILFPSVYDDHLFIVEELLNFRVCLLLSQVICELPLFLDLFVLRDGLILDFD